MIDLINIVAFIGPSGSGKTTLSRDMGIKKVITYTTRPIREGERDGIDYHFRSRDNLLRMYEEGELFEYTEYNGNLYGTGLKPFRDAVNNKKTICVAVDLKGARKLLDHFGENLLIVGVTAPFGECIERMEIRGEGHIGKRSALYHKEIDILIEISHVIINNAKENWEKSRMIAEAIGRSIRLNQGEKHVVS